MLLYTTVKFLKIYSDEKDAEEDFNADSAYAGEKQRAIISQKEMTDKTCKKVQNNPVTEQEIATNREKSRVRSRVEHVFGFMEGSMNEMNLTYNMFRKIQTL